MSFRENPSQQMTILDATYGLTEREQKALENSWAKYFAEEIFPYINEEPYKVLYSSQNSRPNTPVNICIGALIIKEMQGISDDEVVENMMLDIRYQYALHTTSYTEQPISDKTLTRFRKRCYAYESYTGIDLIHDTMVDLAEQIAKFMDISPDIKRMDSMMIDANIKNLNRLELIYTCISKLCIYLVKKAKVNIPDELNHYTEDNDFNKVIYHNRSEETDEKMLTLLKDADTLFDFCKDTYDDVTEYQLFTRCISEQTIVDDSSRRLRTKEDGGYNSTILQNPSDPEATFRSKAGKEYKGYVANLVESVGANGSVVTDYQLEQNIYSDSQFIKDYIDKQEYTNENSIIVADGAYAGEDISASARDKNINLITTDLTGRDVDTIVTEFTFDEETNKILSCPMGNEPKKSRFNPKTGTYTASFDSNHCKDCPHRGQCNAKVHKYVSNISFTTKTLFRAETRIQMQSEEFKLYARIRNGVETIPSVLRNVYDADKMPRGKQKKRFYLGCKIGALNFKKLLAFVKHRGHYAQNPLLVVKQA